MEDKEARKIVNNYLSESAYKQKDDDFFKGNGWEVVDLEIPYAMSVIMQSLEEKDKEIEEKDTKLIETKEANRQLAVEIEQLKKQIKYLHSGEYINQLRFERDMLQDLVDTKKLSEYDKQWIDCTHRNTELLAQVEQLKKQIDLMAEYIKQNVEEHCKYYNSEIKYDGEEIMGGYGFSKSIKCPNCNKEIVLECDFIEDDTWKDIKKWFKSIKEKLWKK